MFIKSILFIYNFITDAFVISPQILPNPQYQQQAHRYDGKCVCEICTANKNINVQHPAFDCKQKQPTIMITYLIRSHHKNTRDMSINPIPHNTSLQIQSQPTRIIIMRMISKSRMQDRELPSLSIVLPSSNLKVKLNIKINIVLKDQKMNNPPFLQGREESGYPVPINLKGLLLIEMNIHLKKLKAHPLPEGRSRSIRLANSLSKPKRPTLTSTNHIKQIQVQSEHVLRVIWVQVQIDRNSKGRRVIDDSSLLVRSSQLRDVLQIFYLRGLTYVPQTNTIHTLIQRETDGIDIFLSIIISITWTINSPIPCLYDIEFSLFWQQQLSILLVVLSEQGVMFDYNINTSTMAKKYILLQSQHKKYKVYSEDIKNVFMKSIRKIPHIPHFNVPFKNDEDDTEESNLSQEELKTPLSHQ